MSTALPRVDAAGFARVYESHHQALYRYCRSILRHDQDAQDALQSAMMRAFVALQTEQRELDMQPWLFRIAHNESINVLRRRKVAGTALDESLHEIATLEDRVDDRETLRLLRRDLADLPERQRNALVLRELNGLGHEEIASVLQTTPAAVKQAIFEGRSALLRCREGRDQACGEIQRILSDGDGRIVRSRPVRAHLRSCAGCREFRGALARRPGVLALLLPPLPGGKAAALLHGLFEGPAAAVSTGGFAAGLAAKAAIVVAIAGVGGAVALHSHGALGRSDSVRSAPAVVVPAGNSAARPIVAPVIPRHGGLPATARRRAAGGSTGGATPHRGTAHGVPAVPGRAAPRIAPSSHTTPPGHATEHAPGRYAEPDRIPPGHAKPDLVAPGQLAGHTTPGNGATVPPGQAKKQAAGGVPPGQAKKQTAGGLPPGQAKKQAATPPAPAPATLPPGNALKQASPPAPATLPPGQAEKLATPPAPAASSPAPGESSAATLPPGQMAKQATTPQPERIPPGQVKPAGR